MASAKILIGKQTSSARRLRRLRRRGGTIKFSFLKHESKDEKKEQFSRLLLVGVVWFLLILNFSALRYHRRNLISYLSTLSLFGAMLP